MLIGLNRFLTTEDVRREYGVPAAVADEILPNLPVVVALDDGTRIHLEQDVDEFVAQFSRQRRNPTAATMQDKGAKTSLNEAETNILEALGDGRMIGEIVAKKAGYPFNSNFKNTLSSLVKRGLLVNDRPGYRKP